MAFLASHYIANCFRDPQAFVVASTIARASRVSYIPKYDLYEKAIQKSFYGTLGGAVSMSLAGVPKVIFQERVSPPGIASKLWNRISSLANSVTSSLLGWIQQHSQVIIWVAGLAFVVSAGVVVYSSWIAPELEKIYDSLDEQDASALQAMGIKPRERLIQQKNDLATTTNDLLPPTIIPALPLCQICKEAPPSFACTECGNLVLCSDHLEKYTSTFGHRCPICRDTVTKFLKIKIPGINEQATGSPS